MNALATTNENLPSTFGEIDPYTAYGTAVAAEGAPFLKFDRGSYKYGVDEEEMPLGTKLVPDMAELKVGFLKWQDGKPVEEAMRLVAEGIGPRRDELGDTDEALWERDANGVPQDPWRPCNTLPLKDPETGEQFIFTTMSRGGIGCVGKLAMSYGRQRGKHPDALPVIELGTSSYQHRQFGKVHVPVFRIVAWQDEVALIAGERPGAPFDDTPPF